MSKLFRDWYEKCTSDYDNLSAEEKSEFDKWVQEQDQGFDPEEESK